MTDPITYESATARFALPYLFAGQAQKEVFVNEAHALIDSLLHCAVEGTISMPPASPAEGQAWIVGAAPSGAWLGKAGHLAVRQNGSWTFVPPKDGLRVLDRSSGQQLRFAGQWRAPSVPAAPAGGATVDAEARSAILALVSALREAGIFPIA